MTSADRAKLMLFIAFAVLVITLAVAAYRQRDVADVDAGEATLSVVPDDLEAVE